MSEVNLLSTQSIAHSVLEHLKHKGYSEFIARPWNYYKPTTTLWWLIPSTDWPAYKHGKIVVYREKDMVYTGLHVEKGISETAGKILSSSSAKKLCMQQDWKWHGLINDIESGELKRKMDQISQVMNKPLRITVEVVHDVIGYEPYVEEIEGQEKDDIIVYDYFEAQLHFNKQESKGELRRFQKICSIDGLLKIFQEKDMDWFWVDLYILFKLDKNCFDNISPYAEIFVEDYYRMFKTGV